MSPETYPNRSRLEDRRLHRRIRSVGRYWVERVVTPTSAAGPQVEAGIQTIVATGGTAVTFATPFLATPSISLTAVLGGGGVPYIANFTGAGTTGFTIWLYDFGGIEIGTGVVHWKAEEVT